MNRLFIYGIWLGAVVSSILIFLEPNHACIPYIDNILILCAIL